MFAIQFNERINAAKIIQLPYFNNLKDHIIKDKVHLVDPYLLCLYEFENWQIEKSLHYIDFCLKKKDFIALNNEEYLKKFIILKLQVLLYSERIDEFKNYFDTIESECGNLMDEIWKDPNFLISYQSLIFEFYCLYYFSSITQDRIAQLNQYKTNNEQLLNYNSLILFNLCYGIYRFKFKSNNNDSHQYIIAALELYKKEEMSDDAQKTIQFLRMNFILGTIYKRQGYAQKNLEYVNLALNNLSISVFSHP